MPREERIALVAVLVAVAALRLPGLLLSPIFQDEAYVLRSVAHHVSARTLVPPATLYPPLFGYLGIAATGATSAIGGLLSGLGARDWALLASAFADPALVLGNRLVALAFALATAWRLFAILPAGSPVVARIAAVVPYALSPTAIRYGSWGLPETGIGLGLMLALEHALRYREGGRSRDLWIAGACVGVAGAFKFNGAFGGAACAVAAILGGGAVKTRARDLVVAGALSTAVFLLLAPNAWLAPGAFLDGLRTQQRIIVETVNLGPRYTPYLGMPLLLVKEEPAILLGILVALASLFGSGWRVAAVLLAIPAVNAWAVGGWARVDPNYWFPSLVPASVAVGFGVCLLAGHRMVTTRRLVAAGGGCLLLHAGWGGAIVVRPDARDGMERWLSQELPPAATAIRHGAYTPKVWDPAETSEFLEGRGARLSAKGKAAFEARLSASPRAARVIAHSDADWEAMAPGWGEDFPPGTYLLTTSLPLSRVLDYPPPGDARADRLHAALLDLYQRLKDPAGDWELVHEERGSGQFQYAFRKRR